MGGFGRPFSLLIGLQIMGNYYGRLVCFVFAVCCCLAIISLVSFAFASTAGEYIPRDVRYRQAGMANIQRMAVQYDLDKAGFKQQKWAQQFPNNKSLPVEYSKSSVANMAKNAGRATAWGVATMAAVAAAGWAIDELTNQVTKTDYAPDPDSPNSDQYYWYFTYGSYYQARTIEQAAVMFSSLSGSDLCGSGWVKSGNGYRWHIQTTNSVGDPTCSVSGGGPRRSDCNGESICNTPVVIPPIETTVPVSDSDFADQVYPAIRNLPSHKVESGFKNQHNQPTMTPELNQALQDWYQELADRDPNLSYDPATKTFTYNDPETGESTSEQVDNKASTNTDTETNTPVAGSDWPGFCDWATVVCDWLEWTKEFEEPEIQDLPFEEINLEDIKEDFDSGLGSGSCPAPQTATFQGEQIVYSFDTACMAAETFFKPVLLITASIIAGFIIVGASRKGV